MPQDVVFTEMKIFIDVYLMLRMLVKCKIISEKILDISRQFLVSTLNQHVPSGSHCINSTSFQRFRCMQFLDWRSLSWHLLILEPVYLHDLNEDKSTLIVYQ